MRIAALPGDVNGDSVRDSRDLLALLEELNRVDTAPKSADINDDGSVNVRDSLTLIDLLSTKLSESLSPT